MLEILLFFILLCISIYLVIRSAESANSSSIAIAKSLRLPKYVIGFIVVAIISILPETLIAVTSAIEGMPAFGLGTLFGSNVADLTLVFAIVVIGSGRSLKVESSIIRNIPLYISIIALPLLLGSNGFYSRIEGISLIIAGISFYWFVLKRSNISLEGKREPLSARSIFFLLLSMICLLFGAYFTVEFGVSLATVLKVPPAIVGIFIVGLGTTLPELFFSLRAAKQKNDSLALGDILGTVVADATIVVGIIATISPFTFDPRIVYMTGAFMLIAIIVLLYFMKTGKDLSKKEAIFLLLFYIIFIVSEIFATDIFGSSYR